MKQFTTPSDDCKIFIRVMHMEKGIHNEKNTILPSNDKCEAALQKKKTVLHVD